MKKLNLFLLFLCTLGVGFLLNNQKSLAVTSADWKPGRIIDDVVFQNKNAMTVTQIQQFLDSKVPTCDRWGTLPMWSGGPTRAQWSADNGKDLAPYTCLKEYVENPTTKANNASDPTINVPGGLSAAQLIYNASQAQNINPQVYLVLLQKEQSLVTDDWPYAKQFERATGNNCPDTAPCNPAYAWLSTQVNNAGAQFNYYVTHFDQYNYAPGLNNILYNPNAACGRQSVFIENAFTAALYIYTPYVPNQAALNNMYGTGDGCSAYGNRNFWRLFTDWFGSTRQGEFALVVAADLSDQTQYILLDNRVYPIPNPEIKEAWGLLNKDLLFIDPAYLSGLPRGNALGRVVRPSGDLGVWFVDGGRRYRFGSYEMMVAWGYDASSVADIPASISNQTADSGSLSYGLNRASNNGKYLVDGGPLRQFSDQRTQYTWDGDGVIGLTLSESFFTNRIMGSPISGFAYQNGGKLYIIARGTKIELTSSLASLYGASLASAPAISDASVNRLYSQSPSHFMRASGSTTVYMVDAGVKRPVLSPDVLTAWSPGRNQNVLVVTSANLDYFTSGLPLGSYFATDGSRTRLMDGSMITPKNTLAADISKPTTDVSADLLNQYQEGGSTTRFIKSTNPSKPSVYILVNGYRYHIGNVGTFQMWGGGSTPVTNLSDGVVESYPLLDSVDTFVGNGTDIYLVDSGRLVRITGEAALTWTGSTPLQISNGLVQDMGVDNRILSGQIDGVNGDYFLSKGTLFVSQSASMSDLWKLGNGPHLSDYATSRFTTRRPLTKFVRSTDSSDLRIFLKDTESLYALTTPPQVYNLGYRNESMVQLTPSTINSLNPTTWNTPIAKDQIGQYIIFDGGGKRTFADITTRDQWMQGVTENTLLTDTLLNTFTSLPIITKSIKNQSSPQVYAVKGLGRGHITNPQLYSSSYSPFTIVSNSLIETLPVGPSL